MSNKNINNVDQIRDLIFGSQIKEFDEKFNHMDANIKSLHEQLKRTFEESHSTLQKETGRALEVLEKKIDNLSTTTHKERSSLKELIDTLDENLQDKLGLQKEEFDAKLKITKENISDEQQKVSASIQATREELNHLLQKKLAALSDDKLSRDSMAQMLLEVAMKIQGTDMAAMLGEENQTETETEK